MSRVSLPGGEKTATTRSVYADHRDRPLTGMAAAVGAFALISVMNVFAKLLSGQHSIIEIAFYRNVIAILPFGLWFIAAKRADLLVVRSKPLALVARSVLGTASLIATFGAFSAMPMAEATALLFTASLFVPVMGIMFLGERVGVYRAAALIAGFAGVLIMARPSGDWNAAGVAFALSAALFQAGLGTLLRLLGRTERPETVTFYFLLLGVLMTAPAMPFVARPLTPHDAWILAGAGIAGAGAQYLLSAAYKYAPAALVTMFNYTGIVWAVLFGWLIWGDWPSPPVWTGAGIVIAASLFILRRERILARRAAAERQAAQPAE